MAAAKAAEDAAIEDAGKLFAGFERRAEVPFCRCWTDGLCNSVLPRMHPPPPMFFCQMNTLFEQHVLAFYGGGGSEGRSNFRRR